MWRQLFILFIAMISFGVSRGMACDQLYFPPSVRVEGRSVVSGIVEAHVTWDLATHNNLIAHGAIVRVEDSTGSVPEGERLKVFPLAVNTACAPVPRDVSDVESQYPVNARVVTVMDDREELSSVIVVESGRFGYLATVPDVVPRTPNGCLDFKSFRSVYEPKSHPYSFEIGWRNSHRSWFEDTELVRCYELLEAATDPAERFNVFRNLAFYQWWYEAGNSKFAESAYRGMLKDNGVNRRDRRRLMKEFRTSRQAG